MPEMPDQLADRHMQALQSLGWPCHRLQPDLLRFDADGVHHVLRLYQDDPAFLWIDMLSSLPGHLDPGHLRGACQEAGRAMKVAKAELLRGTTLMVSVEQIIIAAADELPDRGLLADILPRLVSILLDTTQRVLVAAESAAITAGLDLQPPDAAWAA